MNHISLELVIIKWKGHANYTPKSFICQIVELSNKETKVSNQLTVHIFRIWETLLKQKYYHKEFSKSSNPKHNEFSQ